MQANNVVYDGVEYRLVSRKAPAGAPRPSKTLLSKP